MCPPDLSLVTAAFEELGRIRVAETDTKRMLDRVAQLTARALPGAAEVSVSLIRDGHAFTEVYTGPTALELDEAQYASTRGPCLEAALDVRTVSVPDMSAAVEHWPEFAELALKENVLSSLSLGLALQQNFSAALNVYGRARGVFDPQTVGAAETFADYAAVAVANTLAHEEASTLAQQMREAMASRAVIEQAKGILMGTRGCDADGAFQILVGISQSTHRKLHDVATALVEQTVGN